MRNTISSFAFFFTCLGFLLLFSSLLAANSKRFIPDASNQEFRDEIITVLRELVTHHEASSLSSQQIANLEKKWSNHYQSSNWTIEVAAYDHGNQVGKGLAQGTSLLNTLSRALSHANQKQSATNSVKRTTHDRYEVSFYYYPHNTYSFIEYHHQGLELTGNRVAQRVLTGQTITQQITRSQAYLLRAMHPIWHGFYKFYDAKHDTPQTELRTIYSASSLYTLIKLNAWQPSKQLEQAFKPIAAFILANQEHSGPASGGFAYSFDPKTQERRCLYVVGTTAKTIFTLLKLNALYPDDPAYLIAAKQGGDWLLTRVESNGRVKPILQCQQGSWQSIDKQSLLYSGQTLSALSRLYQTTNEERYALGAKKIAEQLLGRIKKEGPILGDSYRPANSISSSWVLMSLIDYANVLASPQLLGVMQRIADSIKKRQITDKQDVFNNGRFLDAMTASGNGWLNEVFGEYFLFCRQHQLEACDDYYQMTLLTSRWLLQNAYTEENTFDVKNPRQAIGGFITNFSSQTVRTDAVCHGVNSLLSVLAQVQDPKLSLVTLPERPLQEILPLLRAGLAPNSPTSGGSASG